jgi:SnoaL-like domain
MAVGSISPEDRVEIYDLLGRYVWAIDNADLEGIVATFTEDGIVQDRSGKRWDKEFGGARGFASQVVTWQGRQPGVRGDQHWVQHLFFEAGENGSAHITSYWFGAASAEGEQANIQVLGTYVDTCVKVDGRWLIKEKLIENWNRAYVAPAT